MAKLNYEDKINIYNEKKQGTSITNLSKKYNIKENHIKYLIRLVDKHRFDILRTTKNKYYSPQEKERIINRVLLYNESIFSIAIDEGLSNDELLHNWIKNYKEMGYNIVERKRGHPTINNKVTKLKQNETNKEKIKKLEEENLYLKAELEYSKKLRAVVQARKNQQQKKK